MAKYDVAFKLVVVKA